MHVLHLLLLFSFRLKTALQPLLQASLSATLLFIVEWQFQRESNLPLSGSNARVGKSMGKSKCMTRKGEKALKGIRLYPNLSANAIKRTGFRLLMNISFLLGVSELTNSVVEKDFFID